MLELATEQAEAEKLITIGYTKEREVHNKKTRFVRPKVNKLICQKSVSYLGPKLKK